MDHDNSLLGLFRRTLDATGYLAAVRPLLPPGADLEQGFQELRLAAAKVSLEAVEAEVRGVPLSVAVGDEHNFSNLFRLHLGVRDIFTLELPQEVLAWAQRALQLGAMGPYDEFQHHLGRMATDTTLAAGERALARFALFEFLRGGLFIAEYLERGRLAALGISPTHLDELAEEKLHQWLKLPPEHTTEVRPLNVMLAAAMEDLTAGGEMLQGELLTLSSDMVTAVKSRQVLEGRLQKMNTPDALLIRNAAAREGVIDDEQYVTLETLQDQHPHILGTIKRNTLDQRFKRLMTRIADGDWPKRKSLAIVDLAVGQLPNEEEQ